MSLQNGLFFYFSSCWFIWPSRFIKFRIRLFLPAFFIVYQCSSLNHQLMNQSAASSISYNDFLLYHMFSSFFGLSPLAASSFSMNSIPFSTSTNNGFSFADNFYVWNQAFEADPLELLHSFSNRWCGCLFNSLYRLDKLLKMLLKSNDKIQPCLVSHLA